MRIAVFGGTGFLGYDFVRRLLDDDSVRPVVHCTSAENLSNLARHEVDYRLSPYRSLPHLTLDPDTELLVNFAHPLGARDGLPVRRQVELLGAFLRRVLDERPRLRLIHVSSMSVYEPFGGGETGREPASETSAAPPPRSDPYAFTKYQVERHLTRARAAHDRVLVLRPTFVYGPFGRPWTDNLMRAFLSGDVPYVSLGGRLQPLFVGDFSRFVHRRLRDFRAGTFNFAGPETLTWRQFLGFFEEIVGHGRLVEVAAGEGVGDAPGLLRGAGRLLFDLAREPRVKDFATPLLRKVPTALEGTLRAHVGAPDYRALGPHRARQADGPFCRPFFAEDRLVSMRLTRDTFGDVEGTSLESTAAMMTDYFRYRFTDALYV